MTIRANTQITTGAKPTHRKWHNLNDISTLQFICGHCSFNVATGSGYFSEGSKGPDQHGPPSIRICPNCSLPTLFHEGLQVPGVAPGNPVAHLPSDIEALYSEARKCVAGGAPTAAVLACRKLLMNIAVAEQAPEGENFLTYVNYLADKGYVPPNGRGWVDHIRKKGNEANHEIALMKPEDAMELISFSEMLLKFIYEFPKRVPTSA